jgi:hypothetical protein
MSRGGGGAGPGGQELSLLAGVWRSVALRRPGRVEPGRVPAAAAPRGDVRRRCGPARDLRLGAQRRAPKAVVCRSVLARDPSLRGAPRTGSAVPRQRELRSRSALSRRSLRATRARRRGAPRAAGRNLSQRPRLRRGRLHRLRRRTRDLRDEVLECARLSHAALGFESAPPHDQQIKRGAPVRPRTPRRFRGENPPSPAVRTPRGCPCLRNRRQTEALGTGTRRAACDRRRGRRRNR